MPSCIGLCITLYRKWLIAGINNKMCEYPYIAYVTVWDGQEPGTHQSIHEFVDFIYIYIYIYIYVYIYNKNNKKRVENIFCSKP